MVFTLIHPWAVLIAGVAAYLVGWAWYSPILWQKPWKAARGDNGADSNPDSRIMAYGFINTLAISFTLSVFLVLTGVTTFMQALQIALLLCFGFVVTLKFNDLLYTTHPPHWGRQAQILFLIDVGYLVTLFIVVTAVLWFVPW